MGQEVTDDEAVSYKRYSSPEQEEGDSERRQDSGAEGWCKRRGVRLDTALVSRGVSAFRGRHRSDTEDLGRFLDDVKRGRVRPGTYFVIEALDRLTREEIQPALLLVLGILQAGVRIVQLLPVEVVYTSKSGPHEIMLMIVELMRGHSESKAKSERLTAVWAEKKKRAREAAAGRARSVETTRTPGWLRVVGRRVEGKRKVGGRFEVIPARAKVVLQIFRWAVAGLGLAAIVKRLTAEGVQPWTEARKDRKGALRGGKWSKAYLRKIIAGRAALGEHQPLKGGKPDGDLVPSYYPAVPGLTEALWRKAQDALAGRRDRPGSPGKKVANLFTGLLWDARTRSRMLIAWQTQGVKGRRRKARMLVSADSMEGRAATVSFPYEVFEAGLLGELAEVDPAEVFGNGHTGKVAGVEARLAGVGARLADIQAALEGGSGAVATLVKAAAALEAEQAGLARELAEERRRQAHPPAAAFAEARTLMAAARGEETRGRLRQLLRAAVEAVWLLVVRRGAWKLAIAQAHFRDGGQRTYQLFVRAAGNGRRRLVYCDSMKRSADLVAEARDLPGADPLDDLSDPSREAGVEAYLLDYPLEMVTWALAMREAAEGAGKPAQPAKGKIRKGGAR
jgi:DNA invertase Pin-like site-specific DNA recombinase